MIPMLYLMKNVEKAKQILSDADGKKATVYFTKESTVLTLRFHWSLW